MFEQVNEDFAEDLKSEYEKSETEMKASNVLTSQFNKNYSRNEIKI